MSDSSRVLVAVPTYNERENVRELCRRILESMPSAQILFIDDNSPDGTAAEVVRISANEPNVNLLLRHSKSGIGSAHKAAFREACLRDVDVLVTLDADLTHNPEDIPKLIAALEFADVAVGSRFASGGGLQDWAITRQFLTKLGHFATRFLLQVPHDATGALRAYRIGVDTRRISELPISDGYPFFYQSMTWLVRKNVSVVEVPIILTSRAYGSSKMKPRDVYLGIVGLFGFAIAHRPLFWLSDKR